MLKKLAVFFDRFEDKIRIRLSHAPILYALVGAIGIILLWKGVWEIAEYFPSLYGPASVLLGLLILLATGLLVSFFIGDDIILSGFKGEKKLVERTEKDILKAEETQTEQILEKLEHLEQDIHRLEKK